MKQDLKSVKGIDLGVLTMREYTCVMDIMESSFIRHIKPLTIDFIFTEIVEKLEINNRINNLSCKELEILINVAEKLCEQWIKSIRNGEN
jgi:hypothetical protein